MTKKKKTQEDNFLRDKDGNLEYFCDDRPADMRPEPPTMELSAEDMERIRQRHIALGLEY